MTRCSTTEIEELVNLYYERIGSRVRLRILNLDKYTHELKFTSIYAGKYHTESFFLDTALYDYLYYYCLDRYVRKAAVDLY